ncbi:very-long-chain (3R)-3-hydroxyacyl-CoA dehydratase-like [Lethenteron reissneri]|uniref:very-long-chain (3R)-3-hydroxyacyl-CoA dehydratase-like n=1 Tax=Lethenteron reissneri TaxID=7753 RepID=UPI002AB6F554|nr:very-long-chain (3R)-3-hydroxyacyl-CoA dehydratase-like [Lethenteron reissneri]
MAMKTTRFRPTGVGRAQALDRKNSQGSSESSFDVSSSYFEPARKYYLFIYSLMQFLGHSWVFVNMTVRMLHFGEDSMIDTFYAIGEVMSYCQALSLLEVINSLLGLSKSALIPTILQVLSRNLLLFVVIWNQEELQNTVVVFAVFYLWSSIEIFRYPYYMLASLSMEWELLTWLRYSFWLPLCPLLLFAEVICVLQSLEHFEHSGEVFLNLQEPLNISALFPYVLYTYLLLILPLRFIVNSHYLYKQRQKNLEMLKQKFQ